MIIYIIYQINKVSFTLYILLDMVHTDKKGGSGGKTIISLSAL